MGFGLDMFQRSILARSECLFSGNTQFLDEFTAVSKLFVETNGYIEAKKTLNEHKYVLLTGCSGEGKSFIARKLVCEKINAGYSVVPVDRISQWQERVKWREKQVVFLDDMLGRILSDNKETEYRELITYIDSVISEGMGSDKCSMFLVMTCRRSYLPKILQYVRCKSIFQENKVVDLSCHKLILSKELRMEILKTHLKAYRSELRKEVMEEIVSSKCPVGYPNCVNMFTRNDNLFNRGSKFFDSPTEYVHEEILRVYDNDRDIYALLIFLLVREGEIQENTLNRICNETLEFPLLQSIANFPSRQIGTRFHSALKRIDETFVIQEGINIRFSHSCVLEAVCLSFSNKLRHVAIKWLPFQFIVNRIRPYDFVGSDDEEYVKVGESIYNDLAERFLKEIEIGNILSVFKHHAFKSRKFVLQFIEVLEKLSSNSESKRLNYILQITEQDSERGALFNGSILYWSASLGLSYLCSMLLQRQIYETVEDKFWLRVQASAALVPACWYGFDSDTMDLLFSLGASVDSSLHEVRKSQTHFCDYCTVHDEDGMTTIQSTVYGENNRQLTTLKYLFDKGASFNQKSVNRPLIKVILQYNEFRSEGSEEKAQDVLQIIQALLDKGIDIHLKDSSERTALMYAVANDNIEIVEILLIQMKKTSGLQKQQVLQFAKSVPMVLMLERNEIDKDFSQRDSHGRTLLHRVNQKDLVKFFIGKGCKINQPDKDGRTPLFYASSLEIAGEMIDNGASLTVQDYDGKNILHITKSPEIAYYILGRCNSREKIKLLNAKDKLGRTPLFSVANQMLASVFISSGADVNYQAPTITMTSESGFDKVDKQFGELIYHSNENTKRDICANFIQEHFPLFSVNQFNFEIDQNTDIVLSATQSVSQTGLSTNVAENLSSENSSGSNSETSEEDEFMSQCTIAMKFARNGKLSEEIIQEMIENDVKFHLKDQNNNTILHHLLSPDRKCKEVLEILQKILNSVPTGSRPSLVNAENSHGITALHLACSCTELNRIPPEKRHFIVEALLQAGARLNAKNKNNESPLHCLFGCNCVGKFGIANLLDIETERCLFDKNAKGNTPLEKLCLLQSSSKHFIEDSSKTVEKIYTKEHLKDFVMRNVAFLLKSCHVALLAKIFDLCKESFSETDFKNLHRKCLLSEHKLNIRAWVVMLKTDESQPNTRDNYEFDISVDERHALLRQCITQINSGTLRMSILKMLVNKRVDVDAIDSEGTSLFATAIKTCKFHKNDMRNIIDHFLKLGADPNAVDSSGLCPFHYCILSSADDEFTRKCMKLFMKCKRTNFDIGLILHLAVQINRIRTNTIRCLPDHISPNQKDERGNAIHHLVIALSKYGRRNYVPTATFSVLVERGVDINMYNENGETPLHVAMRYNVHNDIIVEMLRNGADPNRRKRIVKEFYQKSETETYDQDNDGKSPFMYLFKYCQLSSVAIVREMLKYDADVLQNDILDRNTFHVTTSTINRFSLKVLLLLLTYVDKGNIYSCINKTDSEGNTPLHNVCRFEIEEKDAWCISLRVAMARILVARGARLDIRNTDGQTPLHLVIHQYRIFSKEHSIVSEKFIHNLVALIKLFLANKADIAIRKTYEQSVTDLIAEPGLRELRHLLSGDITPEKLFSSYTSTCSKLT